MKLFCHGDDVPDRPCCSLDSVNDARRVCEQLGVPHYVLNLESAFGRDVVDDFVDEYARGRTPIPCVRCNTFTKFRDLAARRPTRSTRSGSRPGHYARVVDGELHRGVDHDKDQSYFLWGIDRARAVAHAAARRRADEGGDARAWRTQLGLEVIAEKPESQDICFVPDGDHTKIIRAAARRRRAGAVARAVRAARWHASSATHDGFARFTIGQRRGLPGGFREPMFVVAIRPDGPRGRHRPARRAARPRRRRARGELARRRAGGRRRSVSVQVRHRARAGARGDRAPRRRRDRARARRAGQPRSRPGSRSCSTTASACSAADSSKPQGANESSFPFWQRSPRRSRAEQTFFDSGGRRDVSQGITPAHSHAWC